MLRSVFGGGLALALAVGVVHAQSGSPAPADLLKDPAVKASVDAIKASEAQTIADQIRFCEIPAPEFKEEVRGQELKRVFTQLGLQNVRVDKVGNVLGDYPGAAARPHLVLAAHLDTVFPEGTDVKVKREGNLLKGPGIGDDCRGLAVMVAIVREMKKANVKTPGSITFVANVGEEGLGDLRGVKALFRDDKTIDGFISIDGAEPDRITYLATGSHRYRIKFKGPGGHSFGAFGLPSAIHAMGRAIAKIGDLQTPKKPKTTFTVGTVQGGTSVNAIAGDAEMEVDMRSDDNAPLLEIEAKILKAVKDAVAEENARWASDKIGVEIKLVGDRPAGIQPLETPTVQAAFLATGALGMKPRAEGASSTDSNLPISLGIPAVTLGRGGKGGANHSLGEWWDPTDAYLGPQRHFLTLLTLVGIEGVAKPLLPKRPPRQ